MNVLKNSGIKTRHIIMPWLSLNEAAPSIAVFPPSHSGTWPASIPGPAPGSPAASYHTADLDARMKSINPESKTEGKTMTIITSETNAAARRHRPRPCKFIAVSGTHGAGKTILGASLFHHAMRDNKFLFLPGLLAEKARECPYTINQNASPEAQPRIFSRHLCQKTSMAVYFDCDRSIAYTRVLSFHGLADALTALAAHTPPIFPDHLQMDPKQPQLHRWWHPGHGHRLPSGRGRRTGMYLHP